MRGFIKRNLPWFLFISTCVNLGLLSYVIYFQKDSQIKLGDLISISSGLISIALALVAIAYSMKQDINSTIINEQTHNILNNINNNVNVLGHKVEISLEPLEESKETLKLVAKEIMDMRNNSNESKEIDDKLTDVKELIEQKIDDLDDTIMKATYSAMSNLTKKEQLVFKMMNGYNDEKKKYTLEEIAEYNGTSISTVVRLKGSALHKLEETGINTRFFK